MDRCAPPQPRARTRASFPRQVTCTCSSLTPAPPITRAAARSTTWALPPTPPSRGPKRGAAPHAAAPPVSQPVKVVVGRWLGAGRGLPPTQGGPRGRAYPPPSFKGLPSAHPRPRAGVHQGGVALGPAGPAERVGTRGVQRRHPPPPPAALPAVAPARMCRCAAASACPTPSARRAKVGEVLCCSHLAPMALLRHQTPSWRSVVVLLALAVALGSRAVVAVKVCSSTGGVLPALERWHAQSNTERDAKLRSCCGKSHQASCVLPTPQCPVHCFSCNKAGKCDKFGCDDGYAPTKSGTCASVRLLQA